MVCIVGASGRLGQYMVQHALDRGYQVVGVCREVSVNKLDKFKGRITVVAGATDDGEVIERAVAGCDGVLTVLVPRGVNDYSSGTAQAVLDHARPGARLVFSCGWHITRDGQDVYSWKLKALVKVAGRLARLARFADLDDQVEACRRVFASDTRWTVVRGSDLEEGDSQGLPVWSRHVGDPILKSNITRRVDFALFMVEALKNDELVHEAPAIVGCQTPSALAHAAATSDGDGSVLAGRGRRDAFSNRIAGWKTSDRCDTDLIPGVAAGGRPAASRPDNREVDETGARPGTSLMDCSIPRQRQYSLISACRESRTDPGSAER